MSTLTINDYLHDGVGDILAAIFFAAVFGFLPPNYNISVELFKHCKTVRVLTWSRILLTCRRFYRVAKPCIDLANEWYSRRNVIDIDSVVEIVVNWPKGTLMPTISPGTQTKKHIVDEVNAFFGYRRGYTDGEEYAYYHKAGNRLKVVDFCRTLIIRNSCKCQKQVGLFGTYKYCPSHSFVKYTNDNDLSHNILAEYTLKGGIETFIVGHGDPTLTSSGPVADSSTRTFTYRKRKHNYDVGYQYVCKNGVCDKITGSDYVISEATKFKMEVGSGYLTTVYGKCVEIEGEHTSCSIRAPGASTVIEYDTEEKIGRVTVPRSYEEGCELINKIIGRIVRDSLDF